LSAVRLPAEWEPHRCCYLAWAIDSSEWASNARGVADELRGVISTIAEYEPVRLLTPPEHVDDAKRQSFGPNVEIIEAPVGDIWMRDIAPTFARRGRDVVAIDWNFNSWGATWERPARSGDKLATEAAAIFGGVRVSAPFVAEGGAFVTDGKGTIITSRSCLLNKNRNPNVTASQIEQGLAEFGGRHVIWLEGNPKEPITSGHVDGYVMFGESGEVLVEDISGIDRITDSMRMRDIETLRSSIDAEGKRLSVRIVEPPREKFWTSKSALFAPAYLNAYVANGAVITGRFGDLERDRLAQIALRHAFPSREVRMIDINHIAAGGGGVRCLTQPVPLAESSSLET
jgi:agmatine deiminase